MKVPFVVAAGHPAVIGLSASSRRRADIGVGLDRGPYELWTKAVRLEPCPPDATVGGRRVGPRTGFPAGFRVEGPQCLRLTVLPDGAPEPINRRIALGRGMCRSQPG